MREALKLEPELALDANRWPPNVELLFGKARGEADSGRSPNAAQARGESAVFEEFAGRVQVTLSGGDGSFLDEMLDTDAMLEASVEGLDVSPGFLEKFREGAKGGKALVPLLTEEIKQGGSYRLIAMRRVAGRQLALFRLLPARGGVNYHDFELRQDAGGVVRVINFYVFTNGEWASEIMHRQWLETLTAEGTTSSLGRLAGFDADFIASLAELQAIGRAEAEGRYQAALEALLKLKASIQSTNSALLLRARIAKRVGEAQYAEAVSVLARRASTEPALYLLLYDIYWASGQFDLAMTAVERLGAVVGDDAYLDFLRGAGHYQRKDLAAARGAFERAIADEPSLPQPHGALLGISLSHENYADTARLLTAFEPYAQPGTIDQMLASDDYIGFLRSKEYREWQEARLAFGPDVTVPPPPSDAPVRVGGEIEEPPKIVHVDPIYPEIAKSARVQGVVILECTISAEGRVEDVTVLRSIPLLDQAAIDTVIQWVYKPTLLNGIPVPVIMTVTVSFRLS